MRDWQEMWAELAAAVEARKQYLVERIVRIDAPSGDEVLQEYLRLKSGVIENEVLQSTMHAIKERTRGGREESNG